MKNPHLLSLMSWPRVGCALFVSSRYLSSSASTGLGKARGRWIKAANCLLIAAFAMAFAACPQQKNTADADALRSEVARLKAEADAKTKADADNAAAKAQMDAAQAAAAQSARSAADAQAQTAADVARAEAEVAKAQAEADEAAKSAAAAQTSFVDAKGEADKAQEEANKAKTAADESQKAAAAPSATESDVAKAEVDANKLSIEVAQAEAARLRAELARAKAKAAALPVRGPISQSSPFLRFLSTLLNNATGGPAYSLTSGGMIWVPPGALGSPSAPFMMNQFPPPTQKGIVSGIGGGRRAITSAQLTPSPATFSPPVQVTFDLTAGAPMSPPATVGQMIEVMEFDTVSNPSKGWVSRNPVVWAQVQPDTRFAVATISHFCTVALVVPIPDDPRIPQPGPPAELHPTEREVIAKANAEAKENFERDKATAAKYVAAVKEAKVALVTRMEKQRAADKDAADKNAKKLADQNAKAAADKKIADLQKRKAKAEAETKAIEKQNRAEQAQAQQRAQQEQAAQQQQAWQQQQAFQQQQALQQQAQQRAQQQQQAQQQQEQPKKNNNDKKKKQQQQPVDEDHPGQ